ncbi:MAG: serine/threonine protein kinase, partial [Richelia sp. RM2_1_2]|nr:serine/threonine protein kinase [Richelia sp. RM2_1_2]
YFEELNTAYLVMDLLSGRTLRQELDAQPKNKLSPEKITKIMAPLVDGLDAVHQAGVFHLDLKPDNIMLLPDGQVIVLDFGAARLGMSKNSTQPFTAEYAAPEVIAGQDVGASSDIFELGMILYEMLTGELPASALSRLIKDTWQPIHLESPWQDLVSKALQISQYKRPQNVRQWWGEKPIKKKKWGESIKTILPNPTPEKSESSVSSPIDIKSKVEKEDKPERFTRDTPIDNFTLLPPNTSSSYLEDGVIVVGDRAIGKTTTVVSLAKGTRLVKFTDSGKDVIARRSNLATGQVAATARMTPETLSVNVELASGEKQIQFMWVDTPGEAFSNSQWSSKNQSDWQDIQGTISHSKAVILLIPPYQELIVPHYIDSRTAIDDLPNYQEWLHRLENWLNFSA